MEVVDVDGMTALSWVAFKGHLEVAKLLIEREAES